MLADFGTGGGDGQQIPYDKSVIFFDIQARHGLYKPNIRASSVGLQAHNSSSGHWQCSEFLPLLHKDSQCSLCMLCLPIVLASSLFSIIRLYAAENLVASWTLFKRCAHQVPRTVNFISLTNSEGSRIVSKLMEAYTSQQVLYSKANILHQTIKQATPK